MATSQQLLATITQLLENQEKEREERKEREEAQSKLIEAIAAGAI